MHRFTPAFALLVALVACQTAHAIDHTNLDKHRPLRLEDAYAIPAGEFALETGIGFDSSRNADDQFFAPIEIIWGALPNLQLGIGTTFISDPHEVDGQTKSGDLGLHALYNFNQETSIPAFGIRGELNLPTGVDSSGADGEITGIITKSWGDVSFHFNAGLEFLSGTSGGEEGTLYNFVLGASLPIGAPMHTRTVVLADLFIEQASLEDEDDAIGIEAGIRHQFSERIVIDGGLGTEFEGTEERSEFFAMLGLSIAF